MAKSNRRLDHAVKEAIASIIEEDVSDPRLTMVSITDVKVTPDQKYATVYYSSLDASLVSRDPSATGGERLHDADAVAEGFEAARARIQGLVARRVKSRNTPELRFVADNLPAEAAHIEDVIRRVRDEDRER